MLNQWKSIVSTGANAKAFYLIVKDKAFTQEIVEKLEDAFGKNIEYLNIFCKPQSYV